MKVNELIMQNMQAICANRTVLIIAHRPSTANGTPIIAMDKGRIREAEHSRNC